MKNYLINSMQGRIVAVLVVFMIITFLVSLYTISYITQTAMMQEKGNKLLGITAFLNSELGNQSYDDILAKAGALNSSKEEKIKILNNALFERTDHIATIYSGLGVGYYSLDLDAILSYGPSAEFGNTIGTAIHATHPGRTVMTENKPDVRKGTMVRGNIMNAMFPIERSGRVIGYAWANELTTDIEKSYSEIANRITFFLSIFFVFTIGAAIYLSRKMTQDVDKVITGVKGMRHDLTKRINVHRGEMGIVAASINNMAESLEEQAKEHEELLMAEAVNHAHREFLARMSHEIRTPMNGVLGMTRLAMNAETKEKTFEYLEKIQASATLLLGIINDILDFSKIEANKLELEHSPFQVRQCVNNLFELIQPRIQEKKLQFNLSIDDSIPDFLVGDSLKFSQILLNLLSNAVKFTEHGSISLTLKVKSFHQNSLVLDCIVQDTGIGMTEEEKSHLFKPFSQADSSTVRKFGGTGLGLFISRALIELMNGAIIVHSKPNEGSSFEYYIFLELHNETSNEILETSGNDILLNFDGYHALLAEDNEINREIAVVVLSEFGLQIDTVDNGQAAVDAFQKQIYDLIFMDIRMPIMDGFESTQHIRELEIAKGLSRIPIIAMTANAMKEDREASKQAGMDAHIAKPLDIDEIRQALDSVLNGKNPRIR